MQTEGIITVFHENVSFGSEIVKTRFQTKASHKVPILIEKKAELGMSSYWANIS